MDRITVSCPTKTIPQVAGKPDYFDVYRQIAICVLLTAFAMSITNFFLPIHFETNDDVCSAMISYGCGLVDAPDEHLPNSNIVAGLLLKALCTAIPQLPWYTVLLMGTQLSSFSTIAFVLREKLGRLQGTLAFFVFYCAQAVIFCTRLQFTTVASSAALSASLLLFLYADNNEKENLPGKSLFWAFVLAVVSCLIRTDAFMLICIMSMAWLVIKHGTKLLQRGKAQIAFLVLLGTLVTSQGLSLLNQSYYRSSADWSNFYASNARMSKFFYGYIRYTDANKSLFQQVSWSDNDMEMIASRNVGDTKVFSKEKVSEVLKHSANHRQPLSARIVLEDIEALLKDPMSSPTVLLFCFGLLMVSWSAKLKITAQAAVCLAIMAFVLSLGHLPPRVYLSIAGFLGALALFELCSKLKTMSGWRANCILSLLAIICTFLVYPTLKTEANAYVVQNARLTQILKDINPRSTQLYIACASLFPYEALTPFSNWRDELKDLKLLSLSQYTWSPFYTSRLREFNLEDLCQSAGRDDVIWISDLNLNKIFVRYASEHFSKQLTFAPLYKSETAHFSLFKLLTTAPLSTTKAH